MNILVSMIMIKDNNIYGFEVFVLVIVILNLNLERTLTITQQKPEEKNNTNLESKYALREGEGHLNVEIIEHNGCRIGSYL